MRNTGDAADAEMEGWGCMRSQLCKGFKGCSDARDARQCKGYKAMGAGNAGDVKEAEV